LHLKKRLAMLLIGAMALAVLGTFVSIKNIEQSDVTGAVSLEGIRLEETEALQGFEDAPHFTEDEILAMTSEEQEELKQLGILDMDE